MFNFQKYDFPKLGYIKIPKLKLSKEELNKYGFEDEYDSDILLRKILDEKIEESFANGEFPLEDKQIYIDRANHEYNEITNLKFTDYILLVYQVLNFCAKNGVLTGPGRGSGVGSLVLRFLRVIKKVDPIKHGLLFERFISAARTDVKEIDGEMYISSGSLPDIDNDSQASKKHLINEFLNEQFGGQSCAIANIVTFQSKALLKEILKCYEGFSEEQTKPIIDMIEVRFGKNDSIEDTLKNSKEFAKWAESHQESVKMAIQLSGTNKNLSVHAAGILLCNDKLNDVVPLQLSSQKEIVCGYNMDDAQCFGIKLDNLGLKNLDIIDEATKAIGITMDEIDVNHPSIYKFLKSSDNYYGIFQAEDGMGKNTLRKIKPDSIDDVILSISLGRPGSSNFIDDAIKHKNKEKEIQILDVLKPILKESYHVIAFQEQIMKISQVMGGFSAKTADRLRKGIGKKVKSIVQELRPQFIEGCIKNGYKKEDAEKIFNTFEAAGDYSFNKCIYNQEKVKHKTKGDIKICEIQVGDEILAYNTRNGEDHWVKVKNIFFNKKWCFTSQIGGFSIKTSKEHKFLTADKKMTPLHYLYADSQETAIENWGTNLERYNQIFTIDGLKTLGSIIAPDWKEGKLDTIDLEVDSEDHNFYCNNIVVSNSHATGYAYITAICAYLKANYPTQFFVSLLNNAKNEQNPIDEIKTIRKELIHFNIKLLAPDITKSDFNRFTIDNNNILFPVSNIKGVSEKNLEKLKKFKVKDGNKFDIFKAAKEAKLPINIVAGLILSGSMDRFLTQTRTRTVMEACLWNLLTIKEQNSCFEYGEQYNYNLTELVRAFNEKIFDSKGKPIIKDSRRDTLRKHFHPYNEIYKNNSKNDKLTSYVMENTYLGFSYSTTLYELFRPVCNDINTVTEFNGGLNDEYYKLVGKVVEVKKAQSKNGNNYLKVYMEAEDGNVPLFLFDGKYERIKDHEETNGQIVEAGDVVIARGRKKENALFADFISKQSFLVLDKISQVEKLAKS